MKGKKILIYVAVLNWVFMLCSCQLATSLSGSFLQDEDEGFRDKRIEQVVSALKKRDKEELKSVFSTKALSEAEDPDASIDMLFAFLEGSADAWTANESPVVEDRVENGERQKHYTVWFTLKTEKETYLVFLSDYPVDELDPDHEGLYSLKVIKADDKDKLDGSIQEWGAVPGITVGV